LRQRLEDNIGAAIGQQISSPNRSNSGAGGGGLTAADALLQLNLRSDRFENSLAAALLSQWAAEDEEDSLLEE